MQSDSLRKSTASILKWVLKNILHEDLGTNIKGEIFWKLKNTTTGEEKSGHFPNIITKDTSILIARLIKTAASPVPNLSEPKFGVFALAVGTGDLGWDLQNPPTASKNQRSLYNEIGRKVIQSANYVDSMGNPVIYPTNVIDVTTTFSESEAVGPWTEMGLIGGDSDPDTGIRNPILPPNGPYDPTINVVGKDTLINFRTFAVINKPADSTMSYTIRLTV